MSGFPRHISPPPRAHRPPTTAPPPPPSLLLLPLLLLLSFICYKMIKCFASLRVLRRAPLAPPRFPLLKNIAFLAIVRI